MHAIQKCITKILFNSTHKTIILLSTSMIITTFFKGSHKSPVHCVVENIIKKLKAQLTGGRRIY